MAALFHLSSLFLSREPEIEFVAISPGVSETGVHTPSFFSTFLKNFLPMKYSRLHLPRGLSGGMKSLRSLCGMSTGYSGFFSS